MDGFCFNELLLFHMQLLYIWLPGIASSAERGVDIVFRSTVCFEWFVCSQGCGSGRSQWLDVLE